jgi:two-component system OmpR family response regulator
MKVLLIESEPVLARNIATWLRARGFIVDTCDTAAEGMSRARAHAHSVVIVESALSDMDGLALIRQMHLENVHIPILFLSGSTNVDDRVAVLESGGDDYLTKPFAFEELVARVHALSRRAVTRTDSETPIFKVGMLQMDLIRREVMCDGNPVELQAQEFKLLEYLARNADRVVDRPEILQNVWGLALDPGTNLIETHMSRLRNKLPPRHRRRLIQTIRAKGYVLTTY